MPSPFKPPSAKTVLQTHDAFLGGTLTIAQPVTGFRAGLDSVLLGASVGPDVRSMLDLGAGVGTASLVALVHRRALKAHLVERDPDAVALARDNLARNGFSARGRVTMLDLEAPGLERAEAGLGRADMDAVILNPPFFARAGGTRATGDARATARQMGARGLEHWVAIAAGSARAGGTVLLVYPAEGLGEALGALGGRFGALAVLPLLPRPGAPARRILVRGIKGSRAPMTLLAGKTLHEETGNGFSPSIDAVLRGETPFVW